MPETWTGDIVAALHVNRITQRELAEEMGVTGVYVSTLLNGRASPAGAEEKMRAALDAIIARRKEAAV